MAPRPGEEGQHSREHKGENKQDADGHGGVGARRVRDAQVPEQIDGDDEQDEDDERDDERHEDVDARLGVVHGRAGRLRAGLLCYMAPASA